MSSSYFSGTQQDFATRLHELTNISTFGGNAFPITGSGNGTGIGLANVGGTINGSGNFTGIGLGTITGYIGGNLYDPVGSGIVSGRVFFTGTAIIPISLTVFDTGQYTGLASGTLYTGFSHTFTSSNSGLFTINQNFTGNVSSCSGLLGITFPPIGSFSGHFSGVITGSGFNTQPITGQIIQNMSGLLYETEGDLSFFLAESGVYTGAPNYLVNFWSREINKKLFQFSGIPSTNG